MIQKYGGKCACCGETEPMFLTFDHINNDGHIERKSLRESGANLVRRIELTDREDIQVLCYNCNCAKGHYGVCPHEVMRGAQLPEFRTNRRPLTICPTSK